MYFGGWPHRAAQPPPVFAIFFEGGHYRARKTSSTGSQRDASLGQFYFPEGGWLVEGGLHLNAGRLTLAAQVTTISRGRRRVLSPISHLRW